MTFEAMDDLHGGPELRRSHNSRPAVTTVGVVLGVFGMGLGVGLVIASFVVGLGTASSFALSLSGTLIVVMFTALILISAARRRPRLDDQS